MKKIKLGEVGVDSGQLLICDPCYIDGEWKCEYFSDVRQYKHKVTGDILQYKIDFRNYEEVIDKYGQTMNQLNRTGDWEEVKPPPAKENFSYNACCRASHKGPNQLNYEMGHAGIGVAFSSGYGDGVYNVYGYENGDGRIVKVEIIMK